MGWIRNRLPSPGTVLGTIAIALAITGSAIGADALSSALSKKDKKVVKKIANKSAKKVVKKLGKKVARQQAIKQIAGKAPGLSVAHAATAGDAENAERAAKTDQLTVIPLTHAEPTEGPDSNAAREAAPEIPLFSKGQISIYGKCFRNTGTGFLAWGTYVRTSADGALFDAAEDGINGGNMPNSFLNTDTPETQRELAANSAPANYARFENTPGDTANSGYEGNFSILGADGTALRGFTYHGGKQGTTPHDGGFGPGDGCVFGGFVIG